MTKNQKNNAVGDTLSPALKPDANSLHAGPDQGLHIQADKAPIPPPPNKNANLATGLKNKSQAEPAPGTCVQKLWFSFFFDGTGNNRDADVGTLKHSNVVRLYRAHEEDDEDKGIYRIYIPGVGTYFKEVGDDGVGLASEKGGLGAGYKGEERLAWALTQFDQKMAFHIQRAKNPLNAIVEINIAVFGFSRGAAAARAFIFDFVGDRCKEDTGNIWRLMPGGYKIHIRFMGLFDTVASVGSPMSTNNTAVTGAVAFGLNYIIKERLNSTAFAETRPLRLAVGNNGEARVGADPAPGKHNGHSSWGGKMRIPKMVEEVQHFVAGHEIRNSFPVDSISVLEKDLIIKPTHFHETVYPGMHSDVGGSYRPGEQGKSDISELKLGLIPLRAMYTMAVAKKVPFLVETAWKKDNKDDFRVDPVLLKTYTHYLSKVNGPATLGGQFNANMARYYEWRFRSIHRKQKGDHDESDHIKKNETAFKTEEDTLNKEIAILQTEYNAANAKLTTARFKQQNFYSTRSSHPDPQAEEARLNQNIVEAQAPHDAAKDKLLRAKAKLSALPKAGLQKNLDMYDAQLLADAEEIYRFYTRNPVGRSKPDPANRALLRPHYKAMMTAYENEFKVQNMGLKDETIIAFFDNYVHDSLAGFAKDATLPSDPRVIYLGGNEKLKYAQLELKNNLASANADIA